MQQRPESSRICRKCDLGIWRQHVCPPGLAPQIEHRLPNRQQAPDALDADVAVLYLLQQLRLHHRHRRQQVVARHRRLAEPA